MYGFAVRWSLQGTPENVGAQLRSYVVETSLERFSKMSELRFKTWRMRPGEWFEGTYVFATAAARDGFQATFADQAPTSPGSRIIGSPPELMETFDVVAVAEGEGGFAAGPGPLA